MDINDRKLLEAHLRSIISKAINEASNSNDGVLKHKDNKPKKHHTDTNSDKLLRQMLQDPKYTDAELMRQLWHPEKEQEDAKRSEFSKKVRGAKDDAGVPYHFTEDEKTKLFKILRGDK